MRGADHGPRSLVTGMNINVMGADIAHCNFISSSANFEAMLKVGDR